MNEWVMFELLLCVCLWGELCCLGMNAANTCLQTENRRDRLNDS